MIRKSFVGFRGRKDMNVLSSADSCMPQYWPARQGVPHGTIVIGLRNAFLMAMRSLSHEGCYVRYCNLNQNPWLGRSQALGCTEWQACSKCWREEKMCSVLWRYLHQPLPATQILREYQWKGSGKKCNKQPMWKSSVKCCLLDMTRLSNHKLSSCVYLYATWTGLSQLKFQHRWGTALYPLVNQYC